MSVGANQHKKCYVFESDPVIFSVDWTKSTMFAEIAGMIHFSYLSNKEIRIATKCNEPLLEILLNNEVWAVL